MSLEDQLLDTWDRHNKILLFLLDRIPGASGATATPTGSRGRGVAAQFEHLERVRRGWLGYHATGKRPKLPRTEKGAPPPLALLRGQLTESGERVRELLSAAMRGEAKIRMFGQSPVRWLGYSIAHESHHREQIMLALKQCGCKLPEAVAVQGLWGKWILGK